MNQKRIQRRVAHFSGASVARGLLSADRENGRGAPFLAF